MAAKKHITKVDLVLDTAGEAILVLPFSREAQQIIDTATRVTRAWGAFLCSEDTADLMVRRALNNGLRVRIDGMNVTEKGGEYVPSDLASPN